MTHCAARQFPARRPRSRLCSAPATDAHHQRKRIAKPNMNAKSETRHPPGLYVLFFTEMWERFGYYLLVGILLLFLRDTISHGGKGMNNAFSADIVGSYVAVVYLTPFIVALICFAPGMKHTAKADVTKPVQPGDMPFSSIALYVFLPAIVFGVVGWIIPGNIFGADSNDAFVFASLPIIFFFVSVWWRAKGFEKRRIGTMLIMFAVAVLFWNIYNQNATSLTIWADNYTHRKMPAGAETI